MTRLSAAAIWLLAFAANLIALAPDQALEDTAELLACALSFGNAHPPGYPLHALAGRLAMLVPLGGLGFRANLFSAAAGATAALLAFRAVRDLAGRLDGGAAGLLAPLGAAAAFVVVPTAWWHATMAEKYPLFVMLFALAAVKLARVALSREPRELAFAALSTGLALTQHLMGLYLLPALAWGAWRTPGRRATVLALFLVCLPCTLKIAYPVIRAAANPSVNWGVPDRPGRLVRYLAAAGFGDRFYAAGETVEMATRSLTHAARVAVREAGPQLVLAACGIIVLWSAARPAAVGALVLVAANLVIAMPFRDAQTYGQMYLPALWLVAVLAGVAAASLGALWRPMAAIGLVLAAAGGWRFGPSIDQSRAYAGPDHARNLAAALPPGALVVAHDEAWLAGLWFLREADPAWGRLILATRNHLNPLEPERRALELALGIGANLLRGCEDAPAAFPGLAVAVPGGVFCGLASLPLPSQGMAWRGLLARVGGAAGASWAIDPLAPRLWRSFRMRVLGHPRTLREGMLVHAYAGLMAEQGLARGAARLNSAIPPPLSERAAAIDAVRGDAKAAARILVSRGFALSRQERYREAAGRWRDALALDGNQAMAMNGLGELALMEERFGDAATWFEGACRRAPASGCRDGLDRTRLAATAASSLARLERAAEAVASATAFCDLGNAYFNLTRLRSAEAAYRRAVRLDPGYARGWGNLGSTLTEQGRLREAVRAYRRALALAPGNADTMLNLAVAYGRRGDAKTAKLWLGRVLAARPGDPAATSLLRGLGE
ncbi:MAG: DUF2723 domain-containing protein [Candidatus Coatesbacteria bacterium]